MNRIAAYTYSSTGNANLINDDLLKMELFIKGSFGDDSKYDIFIDKTRGSQR